MGQLDADTRQPLDHRCRRRRARHHGAHALRDAGAPGRLGADQHVVHDRRGAVVIDAVRTDGLEDCPRLDPAQAHVRAGQQRHRPREAPAVAMEHRQRPQVARKMRHAPGRGVAHRVEIRAAVVGHHALGLAGRARGIGHGDRIPLILRTGEARQRRMPGQQRLVLLAAEARSGPRGGGIVHLDHLRRPAMLGAQHGQRLLQHRGELAVGDQHVGLAMLHLPGEQPGVEPRVERVQDCIERRHRVMRLDHGRRVGQHDADGGTAPHPERAQRGRQARTALAGLAPAVEALTVHHRRQLGIDLRGALHEAHGRQRHEVGGVLVEVLVVDIHLTRARRPHPS